MKKPNFVLIMADDLGYGDLSCFGSKAINTPNIDALAAKGMTFTDFHANGAVCTPTRAALMTGRYQQRAGLEGVIFVKGETRQTGLDPQTNHCLAESLRDAGYATAIYGKWHLGYNKQFNPMHHGFDHFRGYVSGNVDYHSHYDNSGVYDWWDNLDHVEEEGYVTDLVSRHAVEFIEKHSNESFFVYVAHEAPHWPYQGRFDKADRYPNVDFPAKGTRPDHDAAYKEMIEAMDEGVGWIMDKLKEHNLENDTLVLFCSDNGATPEVGSNGCLRGAKGDLYEGGHRVPAVAYWPNRIAPGTQTNETVLSIDLLPTFLQLAEHDQAPPKPLDGIDISEVLLEQSHLPERSTFWRYGQGLAIRQDNWKLIVRDGQAELFDLDNDLGEQHNLADKHPDQVQSLSQQLKAWEADVLDGVTLTTG